MTKYKLEIDTINKSTKVRLSSLSVERLVNSHAVPVLIEVESLEALRQSLRVSESFKWTPSVPGTLPSGWTEVPSVLDHPIVRAVLNAHELAEALAWACVLSIEEDANVGTH